MKNRKNKIIPSGACWFLRKVVNGDIKYSAMGDFEEEYSHRLKQKGKLSARFWLWKQIMRSLPSFFNVTTIWNLAMYKNYLKIAFRNLIRQKGFSLINISGLALGISAFLFISIWVNHQLSFDAFHENADDIYRVVQRIERSQDVSYSTRMPGPLAGILKDNYPEVLSATRHAWTGERVLKYNDKIFSEGWIVGVDPQFFDIFSYTFIRGSKDNAIDNPFSMIVTESTAEKYFGKEDPVNKTILLDNYSFIVTAVVEDVPSNSNFYFDMIVPFEFIGTLGWDLETWDYSFYSTYFLMDGNTDPEEFEHKIAGLFKENKPEDNVELFIQPLKDIYLYSNFNNSGAQGTILYVYIFSIVGIIILLIACINYMNLSTARSEYRAREIGMRKVVGAKKKQLIIQFLFESMLLAFSALLLVPVMIKLALPMFNEIAGASFNYNEIEFSDVMSLNFLLFAVFVTFITSLISGSYPAFFLSSFNPIRIFKKSGSSGGNKIFTRSSLVVLQVSISIVLLIVSSVIYRQLDFVKNKDLGFNSEHIVSIPLGISNANNGDIYHSMKEKLEQSPDIDLVTASFTHPTSLGSPVRDVVYRGNRLDQNTPIYITSVDYDFIKLMGLEIIEGRDFSRDLESERGNWIVNESFVKLMEREGSVVNENFTIGQGERKSEGKAVGILKDFHYESLTRTTIEPLILFLHSTGVNFIYAKINSQNISETIKFVEDSWKETVPNMPFQYNFLDEQFDDLYRNIETIGTLIRYFTILAAFIACLGLVGLSSFSAEKRTKEIGVRKILGSSTPGLVFLLCQNFLKVVLIANLIAWPVSYILMNRWLADFPYRMDMGWGIFIISGLVVLGITILSVTFQSLKAALVNPVRSLRYE
ncbi:MAG: FtsX-like permease family protein [bacterium]|nr:FtsX-like permease family protein [bacterium]